MTSHPRDAAGRPRPQRRPPFLFTPQDVTALVRGARTLGPEGWPPRLVYSTLFGLLAATGLRISEALNLRTADVTPEGLVVRRTKFGKSRLLPLHTTTRTALDHYLERRGREAGACEFLFLSHQGRQLHANTVRHISVDSSGPWALPGQTTRRVPDCMTSGSTSPTRP